MLDREVPLHYGAIQTVVYSGEEDKANIDALLKELQDDEDNYDKWDKLVQAVKALEGGVTRNSSPSSIDMFRDVFDCLLTKFPLFYGWWKTYAEVEFAIAGSETADLVFERGVSACPTSVDLWCLYLEHKTKTCHENGPIRELFERAAHNIGLDYRSNPFWDQWIGFETNCQDYPCLVAVHRRINEIPLHASAHYFTKFRELIHVRPFLELVDEDLLKKLEEVVKVQGYIKEHHGLEYERAVRTEIDRHYYNIQMKVNEEVNAIKPYEDAIRRAYFHVTDLEQTELNNWRAYLNMQERRAQVPEPSGMAFTFDHVERTAALYERCVVPTALLPEFWLRYARWLQMLGKTEDARLVYMRASYSFVPISEAGLRLDWARFEETLGRLDVAQAIHEAILDVRSDDVAVILSLSGLIRRHEGNEKAVALLEQYFQGREAAIGGALVPEMARIVWQCQGDVEGARAIFKDHHQKVGNHFEFWKMWMEFETSQPTTDFESAHARVKAVYDIFITLHGDDVKKKQISQGYMEFLLKCGGKDSAQAYMDLDRIVNGYVSAKPPSPPLTAGKKRKHKAGHKTAPAS